MDREVDKFAAQFNAFLENVPLPSKLYRLDLTDGTTWILDGSKRRIVEREPSPGEQISCVISTSIDVLRRLLRGTTLMKEISTGQIKFSNPAAAVELGLALRRGYITNPP